MQWRNQHDKQRNSNQKLLLFIHLCDVHRMYCVVDATTLEAHINVHQYPIQKGGTPLWTVHRGHTLVDGTQHTHPCGRVHTPQV